MLLPLHIFWIENRSILTIFTDPIIDEQEEGSLPVLVVLWTRLVDID
jgi:hypothetical protein